MTKEEIEKQRLGQLEKKLVSNARAILTNQIALPLGVHKMTRILTRIGHIKPIEIDVQVFDQFEAKTRGLPIGTERLQWNIDSLKKEDQQLNKVVEIYREQILDKCSEIITRLGK
jgi:hypothetical protein